MANLFHTLVVKISTLIAGIMLAFTGASFHAPQPPAQTASAIVATEQTTSPTQSQTSASATSSIQVTNAAADTVQPVIERVQYDPFANTDFVTQNSLNTQLQQLTNTLTAKLTPSVGQFVSQNADADVQAQLNALQHEIAQTNQINNLSNVTIANPTISGLSASAIPDLSGSYLSVNGGTLTGAFTDSSTASSSFVGALGIGTTSPSDLFALNGAAYLANITAPSNTTNRLYANSGNLYWAGSLLGGAPTGNWTTDGTNVWRTGGDVGIGTTSPFALLSVQGNGYFGGTITATSTISVSPSGGGLVSLGTDQGAQLELHGNGAGGNPYFDIASNVATDYDFRYQLLPASNLLRISASSTPNILNLFGTGDVGIGTTNTTNTITSATAANYLLDFGNIASTTGYPGGPLGTNALAVNNGSINIWDNHINSWGSAAAAFCLEANHTFPFNCQVSGGFSSPSGAATYTGRDQDAALIQINGTSNIFGGAISGSFTSTQFIPTSPLTPNQIAQLRVGMVIDTNDSPTPYSGIVSGWDTTGGTYITTEGWYLDGTASAGTPSGTAATISPEKKIFGLNIVAGLSSGNQQTQAVGGEVDCNNSTGAYNSTTDTPTIWCWDLVNLGNATSSQGLIIRGNTGSGFQNDLDITAAAGNAAILVNPTQIDANNNVPIGLSAAGYTNYGIYLNSKASGGTGVGIDVDSSGGNIQVGTSTGMTRAKMAIYGSGSNYGGSPTYSGDFLLYGNSGNGGQTLNQAGGLEFQNTVSAGQGYGWRMMAPDLGNSNTPLVFQYRVGSTTWTEGMRLSSQVDGINNTFGLGIGTTSPSAALAIAGTPGGAIDLISVSTSSSAYATSTVFRVSKLGNLHLSNGAGIDVGNGVTPPTNGLIVAGDVGIGTTTPATPLAIVGAESSTAGSGFFNLANTTNPAQGFSFRMEPTDGDLTIDRDFGGWSEMMRFQRSSGNIGIGTTSPATSLSVAGSGYLTGGFGIGVLNTTGGTLQTSGIETIGGLSTLQSGYISQASSTVVGNFTSTGNGVFGGSLALNGTTGTTTIASGQGFTVDGSVFTVQQGSGNIGINTNAPAVPLDIQKTGTNDPLASIGSPNASDGVSIKFYNGAGALKIFAAAGANSFITGTAQGDTGLVFSSTKKFHIGIQGASVPLMTFSSTNIGVGTTSPSNKLTVWGPDTASTSPFAVVNSASTTVFAVYDSGNSTYSGSIFQSSDQRLKTDITSLGASSSLAAIEALNPVSYLRLDQPGTGENLGFIAQQVQQIFPQLVSTTSPTSLTPDGTLTLNYVGLIAPIVNAIQALASEISSIENTIAGYAQTITTQLLDANTVNSQQDNTQRLCVGSTCINQQQLAALLASQGQNTTGDNSNNSASGNATDTAPIIQINGDNPAIVQVGATYNDLGATITGPQQDLNLGIQTYINGALMSPVQIDTSQAATDTIDYVVADQNGLTSTSTRTVIVQAPQAQTASSTDQMASSTDQ